MRGSGGKQAQAALAIDRWLSDDIFTGLLEDDKPPTSGYFIVHQS